MKAFFWNNIHISDESASWRWALSLAGAIVLFPTLGSLVDVIIVGMAIFSLNYWFFADLRLTVIEKITAWIVSIYVCVSVFFPFFHPNAYDGFLFGLSNVGLILLCLLMPVLRYCNVGNFRDQLVLAFPIAGILMLVGIVFEMLVGGPLSRAELLTGNSLILAFLSATTLIGCSVYGFAERKRRLILFTSGFVASLFVLVLTGSRAPIVIGIVSALSYIFLQALVSRHKKTNIFLLCLILGMVGGGFLVKDIPAMQYLKLRTVGLIEQINQPSQAAIQDRSTQMRLSYYQIGIVLTEQNPWIGIGRVNVMKNARDLAPLEYRHWFQKTHLHNGYLTEFVGSGFVGLLSMLAVLALPMIAGWQGEIRTRHFASLFAAFFILYGLTNVTFYHDLTIFPFVTYVLFIHVLQSASLSLKGEAWQPESAG